MNEISTAIENALGWLHREVEAGGRIGMSAPLKAGKSLNDPDFPAIARRIYSGRRQREAALGVARLFSDPAWDILLDILINEGRLKRVSVSSACIASCVPATTALRWIATLEDHGLIERQPDPADARRTFVLLTKKGRARTYAAILACVEAGFADSGGDRSIITL